MTTDEMSTLSRQTQSNFYEEAEAYTATSPSGGSFEFQSQLFLEPSHV